MAGHMFVDMQIQQGRKFVFREKQNKTKTQQKFEVPVDKQTKTLDVCRLLA